MVFGIIAMILMGSNWTMYGYAMGQAPKRNIDITFLLITTSLFGFLLSLSVGICKGFPQTENAALLLALGSQFLCGVVNFYQLKLMSKAMQVGPNGIIWSILQSGFIFPFFMGIVFFHEPLTAMRLLGFFVVLASLYLFGTGKEDPEKKYGSWKIYTFAAFAVTGVCQSLNNLPSYFPGAAAVDSSWRAAFFCIGMACGGIFAEIRGGVKQFFSQYSTQLHQREFWLFCILLEGISFLFRYFLLYPGMDSLSLHKAGAIAFPLMVSSCIIIFDLFSLLVLREKHRPSQWAALALCIAGAVALSL